MQRSYVLLTALLVLLNTVLVAEDVYAQERELRTLERPPAECPIGYKCLTNAQAAELSEVAENHNCMIDSAQSGDLDMEFKDQRVVITRDGQVLTDDKLEGELRWCRWKLKFSVDNNVAVTKQKPPVAPEWGFRLRVKLGFVWLPSNLGGELGEMFDPVLAFEPFYWRMLHVQAHSGLKQGGLSLGVDLTKNLGLLGGAAVEYGTGDLISVFGVSLSFN